MGLKMKEKKALTREISKRYQQAGKKGKTKILEKRASLSDILCKWQNIIRTEPVLFQTQWQTGLEPAPILLSA